MTPADDIPFAPDPHVKALRRVADELRDGDRMPIFRDADELAALLSEAAARLEAQHDPAFEAPHGHMVVGDTLGQWRAPDGCIMVGLAMRNAYAADLLGLDPVTMDTPDHDPRGSDHRVRGAI